MPNEYVHGYSDNIEPHIKAIVDAKRHLMEVAGSTDYDWKEVCDRCGADITFDDLAKLYATSDDIKHTIYTLTDIPKVCELLKQTKPIVDYSAFDLAIKNKLEPEFGEIMYEPSAYVKQLEIALLHAMPTDRLAAECYEAVLDDRGINESVVKEIVTSTMSQLSHMRRASANLPFYPFTVSVDDFATDTENLLIDVDMLEAIKDFDNYDLLVKVNGDYWTGDKEPEASEDNVKYLELEESTEDVSGDDLNLDISSDSADSGINIGRFLSQYMPSSKEDDAPATMVETKISVKTDAPDEFIGDENTVAEAAMIVSAAEDATDAADAALQPLLEALGQEGVDPDNVTVEQVAKEIETSLDDAISEILSMEGEVSDTEVTD